MGWRIPLSFPVLAVCILTGCEGSTPEQGDLPAAESGSVPDYEAIANLLLARMDLQPGEQVLLVAQAGRWDPLLPLLQSGVTQAGATDLGAVDVFGMPIAAAEPRPFADGLAATDPSGWREALDDVDLALMLPGAVPTEADVDVYRALQEVLRAGHGRTIHFHWEGATAMDGATLSVDDEVDRTYQTALLETDYEALGEDQRAFESALRAGQVRVTTPAGTDLTFRVGDRPVTRQDGDASATRAAAARNLIDREVELPAGAIRVSPVLTSVQGTIAFPPAVWGGERVEGLRVRFEEGRVVEATADMGIEGFERETSAAGEAGRSFRELALGFNPLLAVPDSSDPWIPYYGYGAGVVRLSLGDNTELGGTVGGGYVRWNFFTDATVEIDGFPWVRDGRMPPSP
ncbi:MAG: aminopeptidase [Gemmatimonadota bacterium]|nr:aminopeptidase [Gemmatimonadota bacterium]